MAIIAVILGAQFFGVGLSFFGGGSGGETPQQQYTLQLPVKFTVRDAITGSPISGTLYIYDVNDKLLETVTITSGSGTSGDAYVSGTQLKLFFTASGYGADIIDFEVPSAYSDSQTYYYATIDAYAYPAEADFSISILSETGAQVATESTYNNYTMSGSEADFYVHLVCPAEKALIGYDDPVEDEEDAVILVLKLSDTLATVDVSGKTETRVEYGGSAYYIIELDDIIATKEDPVSEDILFTFYYGGSNPVGITAYIYTNVDPAVFVSALAADSDTALQDSTTTFYVL